MRNIGDPRTEGDYAPRPRDYMNMQAAARSNALRRAGMDFMLAGNRQPGMGGMFTPGAGLGFQMPGNAGVVPAANAGKAPASFLPTPLTWQQIQAGQKPVTSFPNMPQNPMFQNVPNKGFGFLVPANRPPVLKTGGPNPPVKVK